MRIHAVAIVIVMGCRGSDSPPPRPPSPAEAAVAAPPDAPQPDAAKSARVSWSFDSDAIDTAPAGFRSLRTGPGALGRWHVQRADDAPTTPHVVAQLDPDVTSARFPLLVADAPSFRDGRVAVRCKAVSGKVDQACGLVIRFVDDKNYYIARSNVLEDNIRIYHVVNGKRTELASYTGEVAPGWHELALEVRGDRLRVSWDGVEVLDFRDTTFDKPGRAGLWTKADSITLFDELSIESFDAPGGP